MEINQTIRSRPVLRRIIFGTLIFLFVFTVTGFFILPPVLKSVMIKKLSEKLEREVAIRKIECNPFLLTLKVHGFLIKERKSQEPFIAFDEFFVDLQSASIFKRGLIIREVRLVKPYINVKRNEDLSYNFSDLMKLAEQKTSPKDSKPSKPLKFSVNNIQILNGNIDFFDGPKQTQHRIKEMTVVIPFISNLPYYVDTYVQPSFQAKVNDSPVVLKGSTKPFTDSLETTLDINVSGLNIPYYLSYVPFKTDLKLVTGYFDTAITASYTQYSNKKPSLVLKGNAAIREIKVLDESNAKLLSFNKLEIEIVSADIFTRTFSFSKIALESPEINVTRNKTGKLNIPASTEKQPAVSAPTAQTEEAGMTVEADEISLNNGKAAFSDLFEEKNFSAAVENIQAKIESFMFVSGNAATQKTSAKTEEAQNRFSFSCNIFKKGALSAAGSFNIEPTSAKINLTSKNIPITPLQPYFEDKLNIIITGGNVSSDGMLSVGYTKEKGAKAVYQGQASLTQFSSLDKTSAEDFLKWKSFYLSRMDVGYNPLYVNIKDISLTDFYSRFTVNPDGTLNVQNIMVDEKNKDGKPEAASQTASVQAKKETAPEKKKEAVKNVKIEKITLQGGTVSFNDNYIKPNYSANLLEIGGRISGLSSEETKMAEVELRGKFDNSAPLEIVGKINPLREDLYVDIKMSFRDMDLSPMTPYSGRYLGYTVQKGKLSFDLQYLIDKKKLDAQNKIFFDQLTLGDRVESPDATKMPVRLAIALLKDRKGAIDLDIPVSGQTDDPKFSIGRIILKVLLNLLAKAATSPFALIGAIFGGGEELSYLEFDYGATALNQEGTKKLDTLIKVLYDRPSLKLDIEGHVDPEKDREGYRQYIFNKKIKAQKLKEIIKRGETPIPVDEVQIDQTEYQKYLKMAYKEEKFPKPRNIIGMAKDIPAPEMEKLMQTHIEVKDSDLRQLASQRAALIKDYILKSGKVEPERVFLIEPKTLQPEKKEKLKDSRVDFKLK